MKTLTKRTLVWAHRGASAYAPENTMSAFRLAIEMDADGIELDVHFSKDRVIMVCHDEMIDRTSNGQGRIPDYTYDELRAFDFGYKFGDKKQLTGEKIPTLREVYELFKPTNKTINVEIKSSDPEMPAALVALAKEIGISDRIIYSSFNHIQLVRTLKADPNAFVAPLYSINLLNYDKYCELMGAKASHPGQNQLVLFPDYVKKCHELGIRVHPWTANTEADMKFLVDAGCDAIITNYPDVAKNVVGY